MQTFIDNKIINTPEAQEADRILRKCVHCGFCNATCPTYQLLGDELDGPRGRIYLIKNLFEGQQPDHNTQLHLDRCLTCRACETTCPSGVDYGRLLDLGREKIEQQTFRSVKSRSMRFLLGKIIPYPDRVGFLINMGQKLRAMLPVSLSELFPEKQGNLIWPDQTHNRKMLILNGCVQPSLAPQTNYAAAQVLDRLGISLINENKIACCGALNQHLTQNEAANRIMKNNIDAWWPHIDAGAEAIVITASGCGSMVKEYGYLLRNDPVYSGKAAKVSALTKDLVEVIASEELSRLKLNNKLTRKIAYQSPCSLQHGQKLGGEVEKLLDDLGYKLVNVNDSHLCCGSAGTYSILQPDLANQLRDNKLENLLAEQPELIATANIGCQHFLQQKTSVPVKHWIELIADRI